MVAANLGEVPERNGGGERRGILSHFYCKYCKFILIVSARR